MMKKSIWITIGTLTLTGGLVATAVCVPAYVSAKASGMNPKIFNFNINSNGPLTINNLSLGSANVSFKEAINGTTAINNGTYIIYIGSQGYESNNTFLYGSNYSNPKEFQATPNIPLDGNFGVGLLQFKNLKNVPTVLMLQDVITPEVYDEQLAYNNQIIEWKNININDSKTTKEQKKQHDWALNAPTFSFKPGDTYTNWQGKTTFFRTDKMASEFDDILSFVNKRYSNVKEISGSDGIIIGFNKGKICSNFVGSFNGSSSDSNSGSDNNSTGSTTTQSAQFLSLYNNSSLKLLNDENSSNSNTNVATNSSAPSNDFISWLEANYGLKDNGTN